jgi:hypothetical protein
MNHILVYSFVCFCACVPVLTVISVALLQENYGLMFAIRDCILFTTFMLACVCLIDYGAHKTIDEKKNV